MSRQLSVNYEGNFSYHIFITDSFSELASKTYVLYERTDKKICIVTDCNVEPLYAEKV